MSLTSGVISIPGYCEANIDPDTVCVCVCGLVEVWGYVEGEESKDIGRE